MFERFTDRAKDAVTVGRQEAGRRRHDQFRPEHLLLGTILDDGGVAVQALISMGIGVQDLRAKVDEAIGYGWRSTWLMPPLSPEFKTVLVRSLREALHFGDGHIGTEHLLLGLIKEGGGTTARVMTNFSIEYARTRERVLFVRQPTNPFGRFTDRAKIALVLAQEECRRLGHNQILSEHILLGLTCERVGMVTQFQEMTGVSTQDLRATVEEARESGLHSTLQHLPLTHEAITVVQIAAQEASRLGHNVVDVEHLLLGLIIDRENAAARVMIEFGADPERVRERVKTFLTDQAQ